MTLTFKPTSQITGYSLITLASSFLTSSFSCNAGSYVCSQINSNTINITGISTTAPTTIIFSGFTSPNYIPKDYTSLSTYDNNNYLIDQSTTDILFTLSCNLPCKTCSLINSNCTSCYSDQTITSFIYFDPINFKCLSVCPNGYYLTNIF
jgi:hypothetical protein